MGDSAKRRSDSSYLLRQELKGSKDVLPPVADHISMEKYMTYAHDIFYGAVKHFHHKLYNTAYFYRFLMLILEKLPAHSGYVIPV